MVPQRSLCIAFALSFICGVSHAQQPSSTPSCTRTCPPFDNAGYALGDYSNSNGVLFCSYSIYQGEDPNDYFCKYDSTSSSGGLQEDGDQGFCPSNAVVSCVNSRRYKADDNYTAMLRKRKSAVMKPRTSEARQFTTDPRKLKARKPSVAL